MLGLTAAAFATSPRAAERRRIAWLSSAAPDGASFSLDAFRRGLARLGYVEGRDVVVDAYWAGNSEERASQLAQAIAQKRPDVVVTQGPVIVPMLRAAPRQAIVFGFSGDPIEAGLAKSFARPGGTATGMSFLSLELVDKRMELLREAVPEVRRVAILANPQHPGMKSELAAWREAADRLGLAIEYFELRKSDDVDDAFRASVMANCQALVMFPDARSMQFSPRIATVARQTRLPAISGWAEFADRGNLLAYGPDLQESYTHLATYVDRIFKGALPGELPIELPTKIELVINRDAARALGVAIPQSLLLRADRVIG